MPPLSAPVDPMTDRSDVELRVPADGAFVAMLRTMTAGLAARLDFTIDEIEDLRIAVGEASALALGEGDEVTDLTGRFFLRPGVLTIAVSVTAAPSASVDLDSFAWQVLSTLCPGTEAGVREGRSRGGLPGHRGPRR